MSTISEKMNIMAFSHSVLLLNTLQKVYDPLMLSAECPVGSEAFTLKKISAQKRPGCLNTTARNNGIGLQFYFVGFVCMLKEKH